MYKVFLPLRFFLKRKITYLAVIAVTLCVFTVVVVMTVMNGLVTDFVDKNHAFVGDCIVGTDSLVGFGWYEDFLDELRQADFVYAASPVIKTFGLVKSESSSKSGALPVMGIDAVEHIKVTGFASALHYRKDSPLLAFAPQYDSTLPGCVIGIDLLVNRESDGQYIQSSLLPRWVYSVTCFPLTARGALIKSGTSLSANSKIFYYSDNAETGLAKIDSGMIYLALGQLQEICGMAAESKRATAIFIKFNPGSDVERCTEKVARMWADFTLRYSDKSQSWLFDTVTVADWKSYCRETIAPMEKEQTMMMMLFAMVGIITIFIIFVVFYMIVAHKSKDIGILKSIGAGEFAILGIFLRFAALIGITGSAAGLVLGVLFLRKINNLEDWLFANFQWQLWDRSVYAIGDIPDSSGVILPTVVFICAVSACIIGAFLPTLRGVIKKCVDILRVNEL
ncbi:MAG: hypothetical protein K8R02_07445 [Anaerohalosphaeraceae bacterium]|nr:hypothetical protein [Anaerohalosphaeraceae bacterium]